MSRGGGSLVWVDDAHDRKHASDGVSRFGAYLRQRERLLFDDWEPLSPAGFAAIVWGVANSPVMSPGYVRLSPLIWTVRCYEADESHDLLAAVEARLAWPAGIRDEEELAGWTGWARAPLCDDEGSELLDPPEDRAALLVSARLQFPIPAQRLPVPVEEFGVIDLHGAQRAVAVVCEEVNAHAGPVLARIRAGVVAGTRR